MKSLSIFALFAVLVFAASCQAQPRKVTAEAPTAAASSEWRQLFNGRDLKGWEHLGPGGFVIEEGLLKTDGGMGLLWYTPEKFGDCTFRLVYKTDQEASNSGLFIRIADRPKDEWFAVHHGYEVQILDAQDEYHRTGAIYSISKATVRPAKPTGEWNTMEITLRGPRVTVAVNGVQVNDYDGTQASPPRTKEWEPERGPRPPVGYIGLQNHNDYQQGSHVYFKEVSVKKMSK